MPQRLLLIMEISWQWLLEHAKTQPTTSVAIGVLAFDHEDILFVRRSVNCFLPGQYEFPSGNILSGETVLQAAKRILKHQTGLEFDQFHAFLGCMNFMSGHKVFTTMYVFSVHIKKIKKIQLSSEFSHCAWIYPNNLIGYPVIPEQRLFLRNFWFGEGFDPMFMNLMLQNSKQEGIFRFKIRLCFRKDSNVLILKRTRLQKTLPLHYEFCGTEFDESEGMVDAAIRACKDQLNQPLQGLLSFLGYYDYLSKDGQKVREFIWTALLNVEQSLESPHHVHAIWLSDDKLEKVDLTPCTAYGYKQFKTRYLYSIPRKRSSQEEPAKYHLSAGLNDEPYFIEDMIEKVAKEFETATKQRSHV